MGNFLDSSASGGTAPLVVLGKKNGVEAAIRHDCKGYTVTFCREKISSEICNEPDCKRPVPNGI